MNEQSRQDPPDDTGVYNWLGERVKRFVRWWRQLDAFVNQPLPPARNRIWTWIAPDGYAWFVPFLAAVLILAMALGPTFETRWSNIALLLLGLGMMLLLHVAAERRVPINQYLLAGQLAILASLAVILVVSAKPEAFGDDTGAPRLHVGVAIILALMVALGCAWLIAGTLFRSGASGTLASALPQVELFSPKDRYDFMGRGPLASLVSAFFIVPIRYPVELLLPASLIALFVPDHYLRYVFLSGGACAWMALFLGILFDRLMEILRTVGRLFFVGPQRVVSILVVFVALLRLADVHYITYLFNAGSKGYGNPTIMGYIALAYAVAWYYAFWSDHFASRRVIRLLDPDQSAITPVQIAYRYEGDRTLSKVRSEGRSIALHGAGRLKIEGIYEQGYGSGPALQFVTPAELMMAFRNQAEHIPASSAQSHYLLASLRNFQRSALVYPVIIGALAFGLIGGPAYLTFVAAIQPPELKIRSDAHSNLNLASLLLASGQKNGVCPQLAPTTPRIAVVASGGGTRAAIYTASVLRGLAEHGQICNVVLVSGVSGGSAALGYFALHEQELRKAGPLDAAAWDRFSEVMALPFIEYAIDRASDLRIAFGRRRWQPSTCGEKDEGDESVTGWMPARSRLGNILAESFVCKMGSGTMLDAPFGIMLNTAILGTFPDPNHPCAQAEGLSLPEQATRCRDTLDAGNAGGRLVLTNLAIPKRLPEDDGSREMEMVMLDDPGLAIARAAALSANFPPVFPDAAIDVQPQGGLTGKRYWVTDGGAVENRGAITLYYAIRLALGAFASKSPPPPLHIVIADVSASAGRYSESFGSGSVLGAGGQLGLGVETEIRTDIEAFYCKLGSQVTVHEISMPPVFRDGGIGTHWLLPGSLTFTNPEEGKEHITLSSADVKKLVLSLHSERTFEYDDSKGVKKALDWARDGASTRHDRHWAELLTTLSTPQEEMTVKCRAQSSG